MNVRDDLSDHQLIVGAVRDSQIHTGTNAFQLFASGLFDKLISLAEAKFMAACNAGPQWEQLAASTVIFGINELGIPSFVANGLLVPKVLEEVAPVVAPIVEAIVDAASAPAENPAPIETAIAQ